MGIANLSYEEYRQKRVEENKKRLEDLNLVHLSQTLRNLSPKSSPMKKVGKPRTVEKKLVPVRRSARVANNPAPVYVEVKSNRISSPRKSYGVPRSRDLSNRVYATDEARAYALEKAEKLVSKLEEEGYPTLIRSMLPSHVTGGFWLGLPADFCRSSLPRADGMVTLVDEEGNEYPTVYLARKRGLSGGWKGFAEAHQLVDGDAVIFQVISHSVLKVYILRTNSDEDGKD
uniref:TF-B3 domain-containing protein n=1 Tax=Opuntia streptacantha TaxID=393608 RepID=A0A7C8YGA2_OPUST